MKSTLICKPHSVINNANVYEIHYNGQLIGTVTGADGPGVRIISKYPVIMSKEAPQQPVPGALQVLFDTRD